MDGIIAKLTSEKFSEISSLTSENMAATVVDVDWWGFQCLPGIGSPLPPT
jgi:hypothetical protein